MENQGQPRAKTGDETAGSYAPQMPAAAEIETLTFDVPKPARFAPARADGLKPFIREELCFGRTSATIVYATTAAEARSFGYRAQHTTYSARRATPADVIAYGE